MPNKILALATAAALSALLMPSKVDAWGAAHVGYTEVGPGGVYHTGRTFEAGPYGAYGGAYREYPGGFVGGAYPGYAGGIGGPYRGYVGGVPLNYYYGDPLGTTYGAARYGYIR
jgi:hypothetical protein